ncbi:MAG: hypothetical protein ACYDAK_04840 [Candidatus Limnocylindrales bacterium]
MECMVPVEVHVTTEHADIGSLERAISTALTEVMPLDAALGLEPGPRTRSG